LASFGVSFQLWALQLWLRIWCCLAFSRELGLAWAAVLLGFVWGSWSCALVQNWVLLSVFKGVATFGFARQHLLLFGWLSVWLGWLGLG